MTLPRAGRRLHAVRRLVLSWIVAVGWTAGTMFLFVMPAAAHAVLVETNPADGAAVAPPPEHVTLRFNEPVALISLRLLDGAGHELAPAAPPTAHDTTIELPLASGLPNGWYLITYRVTSQDAHPVAGSFAFRIGLDDAAAPRPTPAAIGALQSGTALALGWLLRAVHYGGLLLAAGLAMNLILGGIPAIVQRSSLRIMVGGAAAAILATILLIGVGGVELEGGGIGDILTAGAWQRGGASSLAPAAGLMALGLLGLIASARNPETPEARLIGVGGAMLGLASLALTGHAATAAPTWLMAPLIVIHATMVAFWLGALWPLWLVLAQAPASVAAETLRTFSRRAVPALAWLIGTAVILVIVQLARADAFIDTFYGALLIAKIGGAAALLGLATLNRWRLTPRVARGDTVAVRTLKRTIVAEAVLFAVVIALTAGLGSTPPPRAIPAPPPMLILDATADDLSATLRLGPARAGSNRLELSLRARDGTPLDVDAVELSWSLPVAGIEPFRRTATRIAPGSYVVETVTMLAPGRWHIGLAVWRDAYNRTLLKLEAPIGP